MQSSFLSLGCKSHSVNRISILVGLTLGWAGIAQAQVLPPNPDPTCTVSQTDFNSWFQTSPGLNQPVKAADSVNLNTSNNCNFYKWSEQMFLWLTSPATGIYQGSRVLDSQVFYQVDQNNLVAQGGILPRNLSLRAAKSGPDGLPVVIDAKGHLREFVTAPGKSVLTARDASGEGAAEIATVKAGEDGKAVFLNAEGKPVEKFKPEITADMLPQTLGRLAQFATPPEGVTALTATDVHRQIARALTDKHVLIQVGTKSGPVFIEAGTGIVVNLGPGQAGDGVLISQQNATVFYEILVNDVYAWYLTGRKTQSGISPEYDPNNSSTYGLFPTSQTDLTSIIDFSKTHGGPSSFPDQQALAVEVKLAWVDAATLPNGTQGYITTQAFVPVYNTSNSADWVPSGSKLATVALVGAHVVGSAKGHPEMVWATFEHQANTPLAQYEYKSGGQNVTVQQNTSGNWLFSANGASGTFNTQLATFCPRGQTDPACTSAQAQHIVAQNKSVAIGPSNILRQKAWGVASNGLPNQEDKTPADANTEIVSINTDVRSKLSAAGAGADPRFNYLLIGATWTFGGNEPTCPFPNVVCAQIPGKPAANQIGTSMLENSTMETFFQGTDTTTTGTTLNCMDCHQSTGNNPNVKANTSVSHIFGGINPLQTFLRMKK